MIFGIGGCVVHRCHRCYVHATARPTSSTSWNAIAASYGSLDYAGFIASGRRQRPARRMPTTWNWFDTFGVMVAGSWLFAYSYCITFIAGEVKRPDKTIILSNLFAIIVPGVFMLWAAVALYGLVELQVPLGHAVRRQRRQRPGGLHRAVEHATSSASSAMVTHEQDRRCSSRCSRSSRSPCGGSRCRTWPSRASSSPGAWTAWAPSGSPTSTRASRARSRTTSCASCSAEILIALYVFWQNDPMQDCRSPPWRSSRCSASRPSPPCSSPTSKRAKGIWDASPYKTWKLLGIPVVTIGRDRRPRLPGILAVLLLLPRPDKRLEGFTTNTAILIARDAGSLGIIWYFFWKQRSKSVGVDVSMTYGELPPE